MPFADLLNGGQLSAWSNVIVIWAIRSESEYQVLEHSLCLRAYSSERIQIHVYITQPAARDAIVALESMVPAPRMQDNQGQSVPIPSTGLALQSRFVSSCAPDITQPTARETIAALESMVPAPRMQDNHGQPVPSIGLALQSRFVSSCAPGFVLFFAVKMQCQMSTRAKSWQSGVFSWSIATHGSALIVSYFAVILSALCLALFAYAAWRAARETCLKSLLRFLWISAETRLPADLPVHLQQAMPITLPQPFLIKEGRPDISKVVCESAQEGTTLSLHACGPSSLLDEVRSAVAKSRASRQRVELTIEQSEW